MHLQFQLFFSFEIFIVIRETQLANRKAKASERSPLTLPPLYCRVAVKRRVLLAAGESQGRSMPIWRLAEAAALCAAAALPPARHRQQPRGHCTLMHFQQLLFGSYSNIFLILVLAHSFLKTLCNTVGCSEIFGATEGQLVLKYLFCVLNFFQKNEQKYVI